MHASCVCVPSMCIHTECGKARRKVYLMSLPSLLPFNLLYFCKILVAHIITDASSALCLLVLFPFMQGSYTHDAVGFSIYIFRLRTAQYLTYRRSRCSKNHPWTSAQPLVAQELSSICHKVHPSLLPLHYIHSPEIHVSSHSLTFLLSHHIYF
jgi:hypothetical protein